MAGCSKKQYAVLMSSPEGKKLASEMGGMEQEAFDNAFSELLGQGGSDYNRDEDEDYKDFDPDSEDDFGFDEEDDYESTIDEMRADNVNLKDPKEVLEYLGANMGLDREDQVRFMERMGYTVDDIERLRNPDDFDDDDDDFGDGEIFTDNDNKHVEEYAERYGVDGDKLKSAIEAKTLEYMKKGASVTNAKNDAMEKILDQVANGAFEEQKAEQVKAAEESVAAEENPAPAPKNPYRTPEDMVDGELKKAGWSDEQIKKLTKDDYDYLSAMYKRILGLDFSKEGLNDIHDLVNGEQ